MRGRALRAAEILIERAFGPPPKVVEVAAPDGLATMSRAKLIDELHAALTGFGIDPAGLKGAD
jgi:hypothetical protein